jgi:hypothetical protein
MVEFLHYKLQYLVLLEIRFVFIAKLYDSNSLLFSSSFFPIALFFLLLPSFDFHSLQQFSILESHSLWRSQLSALKKCIKPWSVSESLYLQEMGHLSGAASG